MSGSDRSKIPPHLREYAWKQGEGGNARVRTEGTRRKIQAKFLKELCEDFDLYGRTAIQCARMLDPVAYVKVVAALLPKEVEVLRPLEGLSDDELAGIAERLRTLSSATADRSGDITPGESSKIN